MVNFTSEYKGELRTIAKHEPSGDTLTTDAPTDNHGKGETFSPTDLIATALGSCMVTILGIVAQRKGLQFGEVTWSSQKIMTDAPRRIGTIAIALTIQKRNLSDADCKMLENAARKCPVALSLHPDIKQEIKFNWVN